MILKRKLKLMPVFALLTLLLSSVFTQAQIYNPVSWSTEVVEGENGEIELKIHATIDEGWHLYSQTLPSEDGPVATEFTFPEGDQYELIGKVDEPKAKKEYDPNFDMDLNYFEEEVTFTQKIKSTSADAYSITAEVYFMVCDAEKCLPPEYLDLEFAIAGTSSSAVEAEETGETDMVVESEESVVTNDPDFDLEDVLDEEEETSPMKTSTQDERDEAGDDFIVNEIRNDVSESCLSRLLIKFQTNSMQLRVTEPSLYHQF